MPAHFNYDCEEKAGGRTVYQVRCSGEDVFATCHDQRNADRLVTLLNGGSVPARLVALLGAQRHILEANRMEVPDGKDVEAFAEALEFLLTEGIEASVLDQLSGKGGR